MLEKNYLEVKEKINAVNHSCRLVVVSKGRSAAELRKLIALGQNDFGENKVQELEDKAEELAEEMKQDRITWHFIGHLQGNKAKRAVGLCGLIHSVDSFKLAGKINEAAKESGKVQKILIEINISGEESKYGVKPGEAEKFLQEIKDCRFENLEIAGLMGMAPLVEKEKARPYFRKLKGIAEKLGLKELSMGMSNDYEIALEEGATIARIGTAIFR